MLSQRKKQRLEETLRLLDVYMSQRLKMHGATFLTESQRRDLFDLCDLLTEKVAVSYPQNDSFHAVINSIRRKVYREQYAANKRDIFKQVLEETKPVSNPKPWKEPKRKKWGALSLAASIAICFTMIGALTEKLSVNHIPTQISQMLEQREVDYFLGIEDEVKKGVLIFDRETSKSLVESFDLKGVEWDKVTQLNTKTVKEFFIPNFEQVYPIDTVLRVYNKSMDFGLPEAMRPLNERAIDGSVKAQYDLGMAYLKEKEPWHSISEAEFWLRKAADNNYVHAQYNLAVLYQRGLVKDINKSTIVDLYKLAAEKNHAQALYNLGLIYMDGYNLDVDYRQAIDYFKQAYDEGLYQSAYVIGKLYESGVLDFGDADYDQAVFWYKKAFENGVKAAEGALQKLLSKRGQNPTKITIKHG